VNDDTIVRFIRGASEAGASPGSNTLNRGVAGRLRSLAIPRATKRDTLKKKRLVVSDRAQYTSWRACYGWVPVDHMGVGARHRAFSSAAVASQKEAPDSADVTSPPTRHLLSFLMSHFTCTVAPRATQD
jgi:hypothetical protein